MYVPSSTPSATTDLFDPQRQSLLVRIAPRGVIVLGLLGVFAFACTGLAGYVPAAGQMQSGFDALFQTPWLLYLWFCLMGLLLQRIILRDIALRQQRIQAFIVTLAAMAIVFLALFLPRQFADLLSVVNSWLATLSHVRVKTNSNLLLGLINYGLIILYWVDSIRRWSLRALGRQITPRGFGRLAASSPLRRPSPTLFELVAGDFIAGAMLTGLLALIMNPPTLHLLGSLTGQGQNTPTCYGNCVDTDINQSLVYITIGLLLLGFLAIINGMGALRAVPMSEPIDVTQDVTGTEKGTHGVVQTFVETFTGALNRNGTQSGQASDFLIRFLLAFRIFIWPTLLLAAVWLIGQSVFAIQAYLHMMSCAVTSGCDARFMADHTPLAMVLQALIGISSMAFASIVIVASAAVQMFRWRIFTNTLSFLRILSLIVLLTVWLFDLALTGLNGFLVIVLGMPERWPFAQPEVVTIISFVTLLAFSLLLALRQNRMTRLTTSSVRNRFWNWRPART